MVLLTLRHTMGGLRSLSFSSSARVPTDHARREYEVSPQLIQPPHPAFVSNSMLSMLQEDEIHLNQILQKFVKSRNTTTDRRHVWKFSNRRTKGAL